VRITEPPPPRGRRTTVVELDRVLLRTTGSTALGREHLIRRRRGEAPLPLEQVHASVIHVLSTGIVRWTAVAILNEAIHAGERVIVTTVLETVFARALLDTLGLHQAEVHEASATLLPTRNEPTEPSSTRLFTSSVDPTLAAAGFQITLVNPTPTAAADARDLGGVRVVRWPDAEHPSVIAAAFGLPA
jgi:hypothetical protein